LNNVNNLKKIEQEYQAINGVFTSMHDVVEE